MRAYVTAAGMALGLVAVWAVLVPGSSLELPLRRFPGARVHVVKGHVARPVSGSVMRGVSRR